MATLADLRTEFAARGFDYLAATRLNSYLNDAYLVDICEQENWPFLLATASGNMPLTISDLRTVESVIDGTNAYKLAPLDPRTITDDYDTDLTTAGTAYLYYPTSATALAVYPTNTTATFRVRYWKVPPTLSGDSDTPIIPTRFHSLIVDGAVARAYEDSDEWDAAAIARDRFLQRLDVMRASVMGADSGGPSDWVAIRTGIGE